MGTLKSSVGRIFISVVALALVGWAETAGAEENDCHPAHGQLSSVFFTAGCTSPVGVCTQGTITRGGRLNGTDVFVATSITPTAVAGVVDYTGVLTVTTKHGTITFATQGTINFATGQFSETDRITAGTGAFAGATGTLTLAGALKADGSGFLSTISGQVCRADRQDDHEGEHGDED